LPEFLFKPLQVGDEMDAVPNDQSKTLARQDWSSMERGTVLSIVKLAPDGSEVTRYPGHVIDAGTPWLVARAIWVNREANIDGLHFVRGDELHEYFSLEHWFNVFAVFTPGGELRGWYANVTHPSWIESGREQPTLFWRDLYVDLIVFPNGELIVRDEDELEASNLESADPDLYGLILKTRDDLIALARARTFPFHER
jgi:Protein of unknown function (DUF402)